MFLMLLSTKQDIIWISKCRTPTEKEKKRNNEYKQNKKYMIKETKAIFSVLFSTDAEFYIFKEVDNLYLLSNLAKICTKTESKKFILLLECWINLSN